MLDLEQLPDSLVFQASGGTYVRPVVFGYSPSVCTGEWWDHQIEQAEDLLRFWKQTGATVKVHWHKEQDGFFKPKRCHC